MDESMTRFDQNADNDGLFGLWQPSKTVRIAMVVVIIALGVASFFLLGPLLSNVDTYAATIEALDEKRKVVLGLVTGSTAASAAMSVLPGDAGTPIAEKLADLSTDFLIVIAAIWLEKYLLTILGAASTRVLVPLAMALFAGAVICWNSRYRTILGRLGAKLLLFGLCLVIVVPTSVWVSSKIENTYEVSMNEGLTVSELADKSTEAADAVAEATDATATSATTSSTTPDAQTTAVEFFENLFSTAATTVTSGVTTLGQEAQDAFNGYIEALAMMIVTSCVIPILVLVFFLLLMRSLLGIPVDIPTFGHRMR